MTVALARVRLPQKRAEHHLRRRRLLDLLHHNSERKLTFISASAGYGKTSLLLDFASDVDAIVCWYSVAASHTDLATFAEHVIAAFQQKFPAFGASLKSAGPAAFADARNLAIVLTNDMVSQVADFCILMIDDFHVVGEKNPIVGFIEALIEHLPEHVRLVIASRSVYGVPTLALEAEQEIGLISQKELRFRPNEIQDLVRQISHVRLTYEQASELAQLVEGWIFAVQLAARTPFDNVVTKLKGVTQSIHLYLSAEVLPQQPPALQRFLLATSIVEEFDAELCNHLLESPEAATHVQEAIERNLFITQFDSGEGTSYQYHQLFCDFLRSRLHQANPDWEIALHTRAADWYTERGKWGAASQHWLRANRPERAAEVMDRAAPSLYVEGHLQVVSEWGERLAPAQLGRAPRLNLAYAKTLIDQGGHNRDKIERLLSEAEAGMRREGDDEEVANVLITRGMYYLRSQRYDEALALAHSAEALTERDKGYRWLQARRLHGICLNRLGRPREAITVLEPIAAQFRASGYNHDLAGVLADLAFAHDMSGNIFEMQNCHLEVLELRRPGGGARFITALNNAGYACYLFGQYKEAWKYLEQGARLADTQGDDYSNSLLFESRGTLLIDLDEWQQAQSNFARALELARRINSPELIGDAAAGLIELERRRGNYSDALNWLREYARARKIQEDAPDYQFYLGRIYFSMGQPELAEASLKSAQAAWQPQPHTSQKMALTEFTLACLAHLRRKRSVAKKHLAQALKHAARLGSDQFLVVAVRQVLPLAQAFGPNELPVGQEQWRSILNRAAAFKPGLAGLSDEAVADQAPRPVHLDLYALGKEQVVRDGEPVRRWLSAGARALFWFICERKAVKRDVIALQFWPDFSPAQVTSNLNSTLWRVRNAVGNGIIVFEDETYRLAPGLEFWLDAEEFQSCLQQARNPDATPGERADYYERAVRLYQGPYLASITMGWAEDRRRALAIQYLNALLALGDWEVSRRRFAEARHWYELARSEDDLLEEPVYGMLLCLIETGAVVEAKALFQSYANHLAQELGDVPSEKLGSLMKRAH